MLVLSLIVAECLFLQIIIDSFHPSHSKKIIKAKPRTRRTRRPSAKAQVVGKKQAAAVASPVAKAQRKTAAKQAPPAVAQVAEKIIVSNLPVDVNEAQLRVCALCCVFARSFLRFPL